MRIAINGKSSDLVEFTSFVGDLIRNDVGPWVCPCGRRHRGKDLKCWDVGGCQTFRSDVGTTLYPLAAAERAFFNREITAGELFRARYTK